MGLLNFKNSMTLALALSFAAAIPCSAGLSKLPMSAKRVFEVISLQTRNGHAAHVKDFDEKVNFLGWFRGRRRTFSSMTPFSPDEAFLIRYAARSGDEIVRYDIAKFENSLEITFARLMEGVNDINRGRVARLAEGQMDEVLNSFRDRLMTELGNLWGSERLKTVLDDAISNPVIDDIALDTSRREVLRQFTLRIPFEQLTERDLSLLHNLAGRVLEAKGLTGPVL